MKKSAFEDFSESAQETLDFARCQRPDGSFYGTGGQCRKGTPVGPREIKAIAKKAKDGDAKAKKALEKMAADGDKDAKKALEGMGGKTKTSADPDKEAAEIVRGLSDDDYAKVTAAVEEDMEEMNSVIDEVGSSLNREEDIVESEVDNIEAWREERLNEYTKGVDPIEGPIKSSIELEDEITMRQDAIKSGDKDELDELGGKAKVEREIKTLEKAREFTDKEGELAQEFDRYVQNRNGLGQNDERNRSWALSGLHPTVQPDEDFEEMAVSLGEKAYAQLPGGKTPSNAQALAMGLQLMQDNYGGFDTKEFRNADRKMMDDWMGVNPYYTKWNGPGDGPT